MFVLIYGCYVINFFTMHWKDSIRERWTTFGWWRRCAVATSIFPAWCLCQLVCNNSRSTHYTIHLWVSIIVEAIDGVSLTLLLVDWVNCENVSYCVHPTNPSTLDIRFFLLFCGVAGLLFIIVVWIVLNRYLLERVRIRELLERYVE